jgi:hypothetical protein
LSSAIFARGCQEAFLDGDEKECLVADRLGLAARFDFPVDRRGGGERGSGLTGGQAKFNRNFASGEACKVIASEGYGVLVEFVADDTGGPVVAAAGGDLPLLNATQGERERVNV